MATFVTTIQFTGQGMKAIGQTTDRVDALQAAAKRLGVQIQQLYWTLGAFDGLLILDAADDETVAALLLKVGSLGNIQTTTARAFTAAEMKGVLAKLHGDG